MINSFTEKKRIRKSFAKINEIIAPPSLIMLQKDSYNQFLQTDVLPEKRKMSGLQEVLSSCFSISDNSGRAELRFQSYSFDENDSDEFECLKRGLTYAIALRVKFRLIIWDIDQNSGEKTIHDIKEQEVYMGDIPIMTDRGTFIVNGIERVIVSQMHRSPGVFFNHDGGKSHTSGKLLFAARVVPYRGSWIDFEFDHKDLINVRIDRRRKLLLTTFLMALYSEETEEKIKKIGLKNLDPAEITGMSGEEILRSFYEVITYKKSGNFFIVPFKSERWKNVKLENDLINAITNEVVVEKGTKITPRILRELKSSGLEFVIVEKNHIIGKYLVNDYINDETGEIFVETGTEINEEVLEVLYSLNVNEFDVIYTESDGVEPYIVQTLKADSRCNRDDALLEIYRTMRPGEPPSVDGGAFIFNSLFFDFDRYDLSAVGRVKLNARLGFSDYENQRVLMKRDILKIIKILLELKDGNGMIDDIDNLGNRRVRSVGELLENQYRTGLSRMERMIKERMGALDIDTIMPHDLVNAKSITSIVREFFGSSQLSQFMDQTNPLSEVTHKRRLSALGPGGLTRDRAGLDVRDVHPTHYGRICPVETPEGPNIGLINSLATYAKINKYGFIETPYRKVVDRKVTNEIIYLSAMQEMQYTIAQASTLIDENGMLIEEFVTCRKFCDYGIFSSSEVTLMDVSPKQLVSVAASLIPFLENDDAGRTLMGSNMQRQAVPLIKSEAPLIGTGMERVVAKDSGAVVVAKRSGFVDYVDGTKIVIHVNSKNVKVDDLGVDIYNLIKFHGSNMSTCITQKPLVKAGDIVESGDIIADGPGTDLGELALGRNVFVAFMSWNGFSFEDSIVISEKLVQNDVFTSIHIDGFEVMARDTKLGNEEITRDIPNVTEESIRNLDETGIVCIGAKVSPGDILVGKVTPKGEAPMSPEEKLLRAIFGEKASDVRDSSLRVPPGVSGTVVDVRILSRRGVERDERMLAIERAEVEKLATEKNTEREILQRGLYQSLSERLIGMVIKNNSFGIEKGNILTVESLNSVPKSHWTKIVVEDNEKMKEIASIKLDFDERLKKLEKNFENKVEKLRRGDDLHPGVLKFVKVFIATKRKLQPGDKMAGRHGNKGVVSRIVPVEDMPYLEDGTPIDIVLNPLGLPSRMNFGQILETHLGAAAYSFGRKIDLAFEEYKKNNKKISELRDVVSDSYNSELDKKNIKKLSNDEFIILANNLRNGIPMASPVFDGASQAEIEKELKKANFPVSGQVDLYDGKTGEKFERKITVGIIYMLKLHHLVDDKIHARSIGPYSLVTQQPLGGKAQFGGQRFGEMEVWALEAYGAAYTLQEMLTVKSDDVVGRMKVYESIVTGEDRMDAGIPESFNVLVKELRSLGLNIFFDL